MAVALALAASVAAGCSVATASPSDAAGPTYVGGPTGPTGFAQGPAPSDATQPPLPALRVPKLPPSGHPRPSGPRHAPPSTGNNGSHSRRATAPSPSPLNPAALSQTPLNPSALSLPLLLPSTDGVLGFFLNIYRVPPFLLPIYMNAAEQSGVPWQLLAAINEVETNYGQDVSVSSAGAEGWMQFLPAEWLAYGVDANGAGTRDPYNPGDAIFAAARYLAAAGAARDLRGAIFAYNHSSQYVDSVLLRARLMAGAPRAMTSALAAIVDAHFPVAGNGSPQVTPVWIKSPRSARRGAATRGGPPHRVVGAVSIGAAPGTAVIAVQNAEVIGAGRTPALGRFVRLRDVYGDTYTYARLGSVAARFPLRRQSLRGASPRFAPLRVGAWVPAGAALGKVATASAHALARLQFSIQPAGATHIDPRPILQAWQLLDQTLRNADSGEPLYGPDARNAVLDQIRLMSGFQLGRRLLSDRELRADGCARRVLASGRVDRRLLADLEFLIASGADPTVSGLGCGAVAARAPRAFGPPAVANAVAIGAIDGRPISARRAKTSIVVRALARLPTSIRPTRIVGPLTVAVRARGVVHGSPDRIELVFSRRGTAASDWSDVPFGTLQWRALIARMARFPEPVVAPGPAAAAVPDVPGGQPIGGSPLAALELVPDLGAAAGRSDGGTTASLGRTSCGSFAAAFAPVLGTPTGGACWLVPR